MPSPSELVAHGRNDDEIASSIGADLVIFQTLPDLINSVNQFNPTLRQFDCSVFTGEYVTGGVDDAYLQHIDALRSENAKRKLSSELPEFVAPNGMSPTTLKTGNGHYTNGHTNGVAEIPEVSFGFNGPLNGADETIGLHNTWTATPTNELASRNLVA